MGVYSVNSTSTVDFENDNIVESAHTPDMRGAYAIVAENEANYNRIMKAVGIAELACLESTGAEMIYEAADIKGFFGKVKQFFLSIIEKIKALFKKFFALIDSYAKSDKDFVNKYKSILMKVSTRDFEYKGFEYTNLTWSPDTANSKVAGVIKQKLGEADINGTASCNLSKCEDIIKNYEDIEDIREEMRAAALVGASTGRLEASEFTKEIYTYFRNGEDAKVTIDKVDVSSLLTLIQNASETKKKAEKAYKDMDKGLRDTIKQLEKAEKLMSDKVPAKDDADKDKAELYAAKVKAISYVITAHKDMQNYLQMVNGGLLTALKDQTRQAKAVCVALINYKPKNESYDFDGDVDSYSEGGFLSGVVLK